MTNILSVFWRPVKLGLSFPNDNFRYHCLTVAALCSVILYIKRLAGKGKFDFLGLEALHHFQIHPLVDLVI